MPRRGEFRVLTLPRVGHLSGSKHRGAFTLIELLVVVAIIALLIAILLPAIAQARRSGRFSVCGSHLRQFAVATGTYAADYDERVWAFSWRAGEALPSAYPDLRAAATDVQAAACQAVDTLRRRAGREEIPNLNTLFNWIPHVLYSHLVIQDYLASRLPESMVACPEDRALLNWQQDPTALFDLGHWLPLQPAPGPASIRWPYSSTYQVAPASYDAGPPGQRIANSGFDSAYLLPTAGRLGGLRLTDVAFPAWKIHVMDQESRHFGRRMFYAVPDARQPVLLFDGSVQVVRTSDTNEGWQPNEPANPQPSHFRYNPAPWGAPTTTGTLFEPVVGHYRWTRGGLAGVDFGADEVNTGHR